MIFQPGSWCLTNANVKADWEHTSDTISAAIAAALGATATVAELVLLKSSVQDQEELVDPQFHSAVKSLDAKVRIVNLRSPDFEEFEWN